MSSETGDSVEEDPRPESLDRMDHYSEGQQGELTDVLSSKAGKLDIR